MSRYEYLIEQADISTKKARETKDENLKKFFTNASYDFRRKALKLTLKEAKEQM